MHLETQYVLQCCSVSWDLRKQHGIFVMRDVLTYSSCGEERSRLELQIDIYIDVFASVLLRSPSLVLCKQHRNVTMMSSLELGYSRNINIVINVCQLKLCACAHLWVRTMLFNIKIFSTCIRLPAEFKHITKRRKRN